MAAFIAAILAGLIPSDVKAAEGGFLPGAEAFYTCTETSSKS